MKGQLSRWASRSTGQREFATCEPDYYRWNQWLFLRMLEKGIAYRKTGVVNWDPVDQTVLANEQVIDGRGWRTGALVEKREIPMYYLRITAVRRGVAGRLDSSCPTGPSACKPCRRTGSAVRGLRNRIPLCAGHAPMRPMARCKVFTTRADTLFGVTYMAVAAEHPLALRRRERIRRCGFHRRVPPRRHHGSRLATQEKKGMRDRAARDCIRSPAQRLPIWVANYVLMAYGEGAVMGVPGHDERDYEFAQQERPAHRAGSEVEERRLREHRSAVAGLVQRVRPHHELGRVRWARIPGGGRCDREVAREEGAG